MNATSTITGPLKISPLDQRRRRSPSKLVWTDYQSTRITASRYNVSIAIVRTPRASQVQVAKSSLEIASTSDSLGRHMIPATDRSIAPRTHSLHHCASTLANCEWVSIDAAIPVTRARELSRHGRHDVAHLLWRHRGIEGARAEHALHIVEFGGT